MYKINGYATAVAMLLQEIGGKVQEEISILNKSNSNSNDVFDDKPLHPPLSKMLKGYYETILTFSSQLLDKQFNAGEELRGRSQRGAKRRRCVAIRVTRIKNT